MMTADSFQNTVHICPSQWTTFIAILL